MLAKPALYKYLLAGEMRLIHTHLPFNVNTIIRIQVVCLVVVALLDVIVILLMPNSPFFPTWSLPSHDKEVLVFLNFCETWIVLLSLLTIAMSFIAFLVFRRSELVVRLYLNIMLSILFAVLTPSFGSS
jgi:hypothetical protein